MSAWMKKHTAAAIAAGVVIVCAAAAGVYSLVCGSQYQRENHSCDAAAVTEEDLLVRYLNPQPNLLFLPGEKQAKQLEKGMTLRQAIALLGKPQRCSMAEGRAVFVWQLKDGEVETAFRADVNRGEWIGDFLFAEDIFIK